MTWKMPNEICLTKVLILKKKKNTNYADDVLKLHPNSLYNTAHWKLKKKKKA